MDTPTEPPIHLQWSQQDFAAACQRLQRPTIIDVRRVPAFEKDSTCIPGALRCAPEQLAAQTFLLDRQWPVVVYCVHGHEVSQNAALELVAQGFNAHYLQDGYEGWKALQVNPS